MMSQRTLTGDDSIFQRPDDMSSRVHLPIEVQGRDCWTSFDPTSLHSYISRAAAAHLPQTELHSPHTTRLTGTPQPIEEVCLVIADVEGRSVDFLANVIEDIGRDESGREIDVVFGSIAMKQSNIKIDPANKKLDFTNYGRMIVEFC